MAKSISNHRLDKTFNSYSIRSSNSSKITNWSKFQEFVDFYGDKTQWEMAALWSIEIGKKVSRHTISRGLKKLLLTKNG